MKNHLGKLVIGLLLMASATVQSMAQTVGSSFFVNIDGIKGESPVVGHKDDIDIFSFNLGVTQSNTTDFGGGAGAGKSQFLPVVIFKNVDSSSPALFIACATGQHFKKVVLKVARNTGSEAGPQDYFTVTLTDVIVSSFNDQSADNDGSKTVLESVSLKYSKIEVAFSKQKEDGSLDTPIKQGFDLKTNKKL